MNRNHYPKKAEEKVVDDSIYILKAKFNEIVKERDELKQQLQEIKADITTLHLRITNSEKSVSELEKANMELEMENESLRKELEDIQRAQLVKLISIALIDFSKEENLQNKIRLHLRPALEALNNNCGWIDEYHYIYENDLPNLKNYKKLVLFQKLNSLHQKTIDLFDQLYDKELLEEFKFYLQQYPPHVVVALDTRAENRVKFFWKDLI